MITRIFRVRIDPALRDAFERDFQAISVGVVEKQKGLVSVSIGKPTIWTPNEYSMVSTWRTEGALITFAGDDWQQAHIPSGMEKYILECWVHHYVSFD